MILATHVIVEALLGSNLTLVVVLEVERHQVQHVPQGGGAGPLAEHLRGRGEMLLYSFGEFCQPVPLMV